MTTVRKLGLGFGILMPVFVVAGLVAGWRLGTIGDSLAERESVAASPGGSPGGGLSEGTPRAARATTDEPPR